MTAASPDGIVPDSKDWTWTLQRACPDCGFEAGTVPADDLAGLIVALTAPWAGVLAGDGAARRPDAATWSPLEYGCHVRDVCRLFDERTRLVLEEDDPTFANWDQDETAVAQGYGEQDPAVVAHEVDAAADAWSRTVADVPDDAWERPATRSNGSRFDLLGLVRYGLHDLAHHLQDVGAARR
ncbi:DinB family protein [Phycicoccus flavus]|uniref:DinB family protein n=1 Tax=Phycicoccus flavus TaxID=2502783 RepID=A0A8T6R551_9MICO|nr:DinB family protein [Phycicoccus flavus]NHA68580.1 DinB family protein [Phycicoccus flavus]